MRERMAGFALMCVVVPLAVLGYFIVCITGMFGSAARARQGVRALDHFVNASVFNGYAWESVSSHAWRERDKFWAKCVVWLLNLFQNNHCSRANKREQHIVDLVIEKGLHCQTIGKKNECDQNVSSK